ncbi:MAG TPA: error-prone DNA polymerase [Bauldia sp.]|nr:error-prone DNA polymerase [Bauldia sp.]
MTNVIRLNPPKQKAESPSPQSQPFAELAVTTNFSFLRGASHPEELVRFAAELGLAAIAIADRNTLAGIVRGHVILRTMAEEAAAKGDPAPQIRYVVGCRLSFRDGTPDIFAWPTDRAAYGRLCRLLTQGNLRAEKGQCHLDLADLLEWGEDIILGVMDTSTTPEKERAGALDLAATLASLSTAFPGNVRLMASCTYTGNDSRRLARLARIAEAGDVPLMATNDVHYHQSDRRPLQDVVTCIREKTTLREAGFRLAANAERHLKPPEEMARLFRRYPQAIAETMRVLERIHFSLDELSYQYPTETAGDLSPQEALLRLTEEGARFRYPEGIPSDIRKSIDYELELIGRMRYAAYFLTICDIMRFARDEAKILCQGRGSAANSVVCYCLRITEVDPRMIEGGLLFERFLSEKRNEPPDIDVDFEHERREEVMQYVYEKYGRDRTSLTSTVITYRARSAIRDVGKVFGLSEDTIDALASTTWGWSDEGLPDKDVRRAGLDPHEKTLRQALDLSASLNGFPRHLSQHVGGFVITRDRLDEMMPVMNAAMEKRNTVEWNKDDLNDLGILKVDVLALGMLTCLRWAFDFLRRQYGWDLDLHKLPKEEKAVYDMLGRADAIGVFQVESRAQMSMLPRLKPKKFYDLVVEVAIVRPGPIQGGMVHPYLRRRQGLEKEEYPSEALREVLQKTMGVPLFQEQAMRIAIVAAGFEPHEADLLRRAMATFKRVGTIGNLKKRFIDGMIARNYERDFAERCFSQIEGFGEYGFPESHAASFALLVYASAWIKTHYPDVFCAALLNSQPMGFYAPAQIVRDAERHGVVVLPPDVNYSAWHSKLEPLPPGRNGSLHSHHVSMRDDIRTRYAVRLGLHRIKGMSEVDANLVADKRGNGYDSVRDVWLRTGLARAAIERLADGDAFRSVGLDRRDTLWAARGEGAMKARDRLPLFDVPQHADIRREPDFALPPMLIGEHIVHDYRYLSLSLKGHPVSHLRRDLAARGIIAAEDLRGHTPERDGRDMNGKRVTVAGLVITRQRPGTASGVIFMTLEDETDITNGIVWPRVFERYRPVVLGARLIALTGKVQSEKGVIHVVADRIDDLTSMLSTLAADAHDLQSLSRSDEVAHPTGDDSRSRGTRRHPRNIRFFETDERTKATHDVMPKGRNFH